MDHTSHPHPTTSKPPQRRKRMALLVAVPLLASLAGSAAYLAGGRYVETDNAYLKAQKVPVSAAVAGTVTQVLVQENQVVRQGQLLFSIDPAPFKIALSKAEAKLAQVRTDLATLKAGYRTKQAEVALARTNYDFAVKEQRRQQDLAARNFISASKLDDVRHNAEVMAEQIAMQQQDMGRIAASLGGDPELPVEKHPAYLAALAELEQARLELAETEVRASMPGTVSKPPKVGQFVATGSTATLLIANDLWIEANFTEADMTYVHPGQAVNVRIDTFPDGLFHGEVESLAPATGAEFSVIPAQNATGNWVKVAQRVPVRIRLKNDAALPALRAGLSSWVEIDTGHRRRLFGVRL